MTIIRSPASKPGKKLQQDDNEQVREFGRHRIHDDKVDRHLCAKMTTGFDAFPKVIDDDQLYTYTG
jgi:hypothetical protein